jgi:hypothetical protein|nr:MAG TPA: nuclease [Caudoviricetes sp.]
MGRLVKANPEVEASKGQTTVVGTGTHGRLVRTGDVQRTSPTGNVVQKKPTVQPSKAATIPAKASSPMFRTRQNVVTPKNQSALAQNLTQGALQKKDAKNYQSKEAFEQHVQDVKTPTVTQRVGDTVKGAAKTYGAGVTNAVGLAQTGSGLQRRGEAEKEIALWDQDIKAQRDVLADPSSTESERETARTVIANLEARKAAYRQAYGIGGEVERTAGAIYKAADRLADSGAKDINKAKSGLGKVGQLAVDAGVAGTQMAEDIALSPFMFGTALFPMAIRSMGSGAQEARRQGATHEQQVNYGFASGALSVATEKIGNAAAPFKKMFGKGFLDDVIERTMQGLNSSAAGKIALSFLEEGGEEAIEDLIQPALQMIYNGKTLGGSYSELEASEILNDFLVGGILGGLGGGVEAIGNRGGRYYDSRTELPKTQTETRSDAEIVNGIADRLFARYDSMIGESGRKAIRGSYQEGKDTAEHVKDFIPAYNAGVEGKANPNPTNETAYAGYIAGQNDAKKSAGTGEHIDSRTKENVSSRNVNAFQFDHPELHGYYSTAAEQIAGIADISLSRGQQKGARQRTANGYQRSNQIFETPAMRKAMDEGLTRTQIIDAAQRIINDNGQENVKAAKTLEIVLDDMLTNGYTAVDGTAVAPNTDYIAAKQRIAGAEAQATGFDKYVTDNRLALETGEVTMDELRAEYAQQEGAEHGEAVHLRDGSERDNGANPRGEVRGVEESTGRDQSRKKGRHFADSEAAALDYGEKVSTASFGIGRGAFNDSVYLVKNETAEMRKAKDLAKERGLRVTFFAGNNLTFRDKSGKTFQVRGYVSGDRVFIRADHPEFTSYQIMRHEAGHDMIAKGEVDLNEVRTRIDKTFTGGEVDSLCTAYADAYAGTEMTAQEIWEEVVCDSLGDMNIFADSEISDAAAFLLAHIKVESETVAQESTRAPPSKINGRASIEEAADGKKYVRADRQVIFGNDPQSWSEQLEDYINGKIRRGQDVKLIGADGDELVLTATSAGKLSDNHTSDGRTMSEAAFERKVNAASHIDELAQVSVKGDRNVVDHNSRHGDMASSGWNYRTAFFKDFDGKYYKVTISTAQSADGKMIYNIGQMQERSIPQINGSSTANSGALRGDALEYSLSRDTQNVKSKFSMETPVEETKTLVAMHNMTEEKLRRTLDIGAWPSPSIAVVKAKEGHANYGEYSAIFPRGTIDPQADSRNKVYGGDAWTPTHDNALVEREVNYEARRAFDENIKNLSSQFAGGVFQGSGTLGKIGLENETRWEPEEIADKLANHPEVQAAFLQSEGKSLEPVYRDKQFDRFFSNATIQRYLDAVGEQEVARLAVKLMTGERLTAEEMKPAEQAIREVYAEEHANFLNRRPESKEKRIDYYMKNNVFPNRVEDFIRSTQEFYESGGSAGEIDKEATAAKMMEMIAPGGSWNDALQTVKDWVQPQLEGLLGERGIYNGKDAVTDRGRRSFAETHWDYTAENIVKAMNMAAAKGANVYGITPETLAATATQEYKTVDEMHADEARLRTVSEEEHAKALRDLGIYLDRVVNDLMLTTMHKYDNSFEEEQNLSGIIAEAAKGKKTTAAVKAAFRKEGYAISDGHAKSILALIDRAANIPTGYYEAKPQRVVGFDEALAVVAPDNAPADLLGEMRNAGMNVVEYKAGDEADRLAKVNGVNDAQFSREIPEENYEALKEKYGYIPAGERAYREVQVPKKTADDKYVSRTIRTVLEAKATPDAMVPTLERMVAKGDFSYDRYTDKQAISDAESRIKTEGWQKTLNKWKNSTKEGISKENTAIGWALYNNAANSGDVETAIDVLDTIVKRQRNAAQALQATRLLKQQDPSTQLYAAQRSVENLTEDLKKQYGEKAPDLKIDRDLAEKFLNAKDDDARTEAMKEIYRDIGRQMPSRFIDKWNAWRYLSMLGNPRTHVRNIVGNVGFVPAVTVKNVIGAGIESAANAVSGGKVGRTKAILTTKDAGLIKAAWSDYANIREQALGSGKYNDNVNVRQEIEEGRTIFKPKLLEAMRKFNSTALDAEDAWFSKPHYAAALAQFCKANGITAEQVAGGKGIEAAREYAIREAQKATYRDTNAFSQMISDLGRYRGDNKMKRLGSTLAEGILPFRKTPANILVRGVEYSPIGFLKSISYDLVQVQKGNMQATEMIDRAAAGLTGTGLMMLGLYMAKEGILRGSGGDDEKKKKFDELQGHQEYAMELPNGTSITLDWLAPEALPFFVGANLYEQMQANNGYLTMSDMLQAASNVTDPLLSMSCLQSLNDVFDAVGYASSGDTNALTSAVASAATSYLTQGIPTVFGQAERTGESTRMTTYTDKNKFLTPDMQYALGKASARIPGVDYGQIPFIDAWGRTENSGGVVARAFNNFSNPAYTSKVSGSKMEDELSRLYEATGEAKVLPQRAPKSFTVDKENKQLTGEEYVKYATKRGQTSYKIVSELTGLASYKSMSDGDKADAVAKAYEYANIVGKMSVSNYQTDGWAAKAIDTVKKTGVSEAQYIALYLAKGGIESLKDKNGDTISNSEGLQIMELVYQQKGLSDEQRAALFEDFGVGKSIRHWNRARVDEQLAIARKKAA